MCLSHWPISFKVYLDKKTFLRRHWRQWFKAVVNRQNVGSVELYLNVGTSATWKRRTMTPLASSRLPKFKLQLLKFELPKYKFKLCLDPILKEDKQLLMAAEQSHLLSVDKLKHKNEKTVKICLLFTSRSLYIKAWKLC